MNETWRTLSDRAQQALRDERPDDAARLWRRALERAPDDVAVRLRIGNSLRMAGDLEAAEAALSALSAEHPADDSVQFAFAFLLREAGRHAEAECALLELTRHSDDPTVAMKAVGFLRDSDRFAGALAVVDALIERTGDTPSVLFRRARLRQALGDFAGALDDCRAALDGDPSLGGAWLSLATLQHFETEVDPDFQRMRQARDRVTAPDARTALWFALGKALDDLGRYAQAFEHFEHGNALQAARQPWQPELAPPATPPVAGARESIDADRDRRRPLFIVGMLRSGTTLLEQRLSRHPSVTGRGELNWLRHAARTVRNPAAMPGEQRRALADDIWRQMRRDGPEHHVYVDKNPLNFRYLSLALTLFPGARVIHMRRDGRASTLSCYQQLFQHPDAGFSQRLEDLEGFYRAYREQMQASGPALSDRLMTVEYQDLVNRPDDVLKRTWQWLGLDPVTEDGAAIDAQPVRTASAWQARQALHTESVERWRHYEPMLSEFFERIAAIDNALHAQ